MLRIWIVLAVSLCLHACTVSLLPEGDSGIVEEIEALNEQSQVIFASVESGSSVGEFAALERSYNEVIGGWSALVLSIQARPQPNIPDRIVNRLRNRDRLQDFCVEQEELSGDGEQSCFALVTPSALLEARQTLSRMRDTHRDRGLGPVLVANFANLFNISIEQALTIESALAGN